MSKSKTRDLTGQTFGRWTALSKTTNARGYAAYECECSCGTRRVVYASSLYRGVSKSCGCLVSEINKARYVEDGEPVGRKYNRLTVIKRLPNRLSGWRNNPVVRWLCSCECGAEVEVDAASLRQGRTKSCGCILKLKHPPGVTGLLSVFNSYRRAATDRDLPWELTLEQFKEFTSRACAYCGREPNQTRGKGRSEYKFNGLDRWLNSEGYTEANVMPCCSMCNQMKHAYEPEEFVAQIRRIHKHLNLETTHAD